VGLATSVNNPTDTDHKAQALVKTLDDLFVENAKEESHG
jgi:hypothetical protein